MRLVNVNIHFLVKTSCLNILASRFRAGLREMSLSAQKRPDYELYSKEQFGPITREFIVRKFFGRCRALQFVTIELSCNMNLHVFSVLLLSHTRFKTPEMISYWLHSLITLDHFILKLITSNLPKINNPLTHSPFLKSLEQRNGKWNIYYKKSKNIHNVRNS